MLCYDLRSRYLQHELITKTEIVFYSEIPYNPLTNTANYFDDASYLTVECALDVFVFSHQKKYYTAWNKRSFIWSIFENHGFTCKSRMSLFVNFWVWNPFFACRVSGSYLVKLADFGMSKDVYTTIYHKEGARDTPKPVKWMAIESIREGRYDFSTEVVGYN